MAGRIPQSFIDELLNRVDIVDVIDARVPLKKAGNNYKACCPFHSEKTPSFTVSQSKQFYHCFGCGAHGTAIGFLMEYDHLDFVDAVEDLAGLAGIEVEREQGNERPQRREDDLYTIMQQASDFYRQQLRSHARADHAIAYLKQRGMSGEIAAEFGIGYAPPGWDNLIRAVGRDDASRRLLARAGLTIEQDNKTPYDRFRDRIMIPITDRRGRIIAFGGRILSADDPHSPKYLNSPETPIFHKGRELYGLYEVRKHTREPDKLLVVEGYMDVLALAQYDIRYAVATLGTATTREHLETLYRVTSRIVFCFDGDRAGRDAAWRALENALPVMHEGREAAFLFLPEGEDPDSLVRQEGRQRFEQRLEEALPLSRFLLEHLAGQVDLGAIDGRAHLVELARPLLNRIPDKVFRHMFYNQLAQMVNMKSDALIRLVEQGETADNTPLMQRRPARPGKQSPVRQAITLAIQKPALAATLPGCDFLRELDLPGAKLLHELLEIIRGEPKLNTAALLERWRDKPEQVHLLKLAEAPLAGDDEGLATELNDILHHLERQLNLQRWQFLQDKLTRTGLDENELIEWNQLLSENNALRGK